jgi:PAS domain S-box-containing protein
MVFIPEKIKLLYIEDDDMTFDVVKKMLETSKHTKFEIIRENTLSDGISFFQDECRDPTIEMILLDLILPNSQGVETYVKVKEACSYLPIVIISAYEDMACECVKLGAQDYLLKQELTATLLARSLKYAKERDKILKDLCAREKQYRELVEVTKAAIYEIDFINNKITYVNEVVPKLTGYKKEEIVGKEPTFLLTEQSKQVWLDRLQALRNGDFISSTVEYEIVKKDGDIAWALLTAEYKENESGIVTGAHVVAIDITETKLAQLEAESKENYFFSELENRINSWKKELSSNQFIQEHYLQTVQFNYNEEK